MLIDNGDIEKIDNPEIKKIMTQIKERCDSANIEGEYELKKYEETGRTEHILKMFKSPVPKKYYIEIVFNNEESEGFCRIKKLIENDFEKYTFLKRYIAICSYELGIIEALINIPFGNNWSDFKFENYCINDDFLYSKPYCEYKNINLSLEEVSNEFILIYQNKLPSFYNAKPIALKIENVSISNYNEAVQILEKLSNTFFFQIDLIKGLALTLNRIGFFDDKRYKKVPIDKYPKKQYDPIPMSFYWYAGASSEKPLLQFLAYYQVIEFYFSRYSFKKIVSMIEDIKKDIDEKNLSRTELIKSIKNIESNEYREQDQILATLQACITQQSIIAFLEIDSIEDLIEYLKEYLKKGSIEDLIKYLEKDSIEDLIKYLKNDLIKNIKKHLKKEVKEDLIKYIKKHLEEYKKRKEFFAKNNDISKYKINVKDTNIDLVKQAANRIRAAHLSIIFNFFLDNFFIKQVMR